MGAMMSATELAFGTNEVRSPDSMSQAIIRIGIMGGLTMVTMNILGAWSCMEGARGISDATWLPLGKDYHTPRDHECLREYCVKTNVVWAFVSALTGALLCIVGIARSKSLLVVFFAVLTARAFFCLIEVIMGAGLRSPCPLISLLAAPWTSFVTAFQLAAFAAVSIRYYHVLKKAAAVHSAALRFRGKGVLQLAAAGSDQSLTEAVGAEEGRRQEAARKAVQSEAHGPDGREAARRGMLAATSTTQLLAGPGAALTGGDHRDDASERPAVTSGASRGRDRDSARDPAELT